MATFPLTGGDYSVGTLFASDGQTIYAAPAGVGASFTQTRVVTKIREAKTLQNLGARATTVAGSTPHTVTAMVNGSANTTLQVSFSATGVQEDLTGTISLANTDTISWRLAPGGTMHGDTIILSVVWAELDSGNQFYAQNSSLQLATSSTNYVRLSSDEQLSATAADARYTFSSAASLANLTVDNDTALSSGTVTSRKNGTNDTTLQVNLTSAARVEDLTGSVSYADGDTAEWEAVNGDSMVTTRVATGASLDASGTFIGFAWFGSTSGTTKYIGLNGGSPSSSATEANQEVTLYSTYTAQNLFARVVSFSSTINAKIRKNRTSSTALTLSLTGTGVFEDTVGTDSYASGDEINYILNDGLSGTASPFVAVELATAAAPASEWYNQIEARPDYSREATRANVAQLQSRAIQPEDVSISGSSAITLPALTSTATGTHTEPVTDWREQIEERPDYSQVFATRANIAQTQSGEIGPVSLSITGTSALTLGVIASAASGIEEFTATSAITLGSLTSAATGTMDTLSGYGQIIDGGIADLRPDVSANQSREVAPPSADITITGTSVITLPAITSAATATLTVHEWYPQIEGTVPDYSRYVRSQELVSVEQSREVAPVPFVIAGTSALTLGALTSIASGTHAEVEWYERIEALPSYEQVTNRSNVAIEQSRVISPPDTSVFGTSAITLAAITSTATGAHSYLWYEQIEGTTPDRTSYEISRSLVAQLESREIAPVDFAVAITGTSAITLPAITSAATATLTVHEWFEQISYGQPKDIRSEQSNVAIEQSRNIIPEDVSVTGTSAITLGALTSSATGSHSYLWYEQVISGRVKNLRSEQAAVAIEQSGNIYPPDVDLNHSGSSTITLPAITSAASGALTVHEWYEQITYGEPKDIRLDRAAVAIQQSREVIPGEFVITGSSAISLPALTSAATGEEIFTATSVITLGAITSSATGAHSYLWYEQTVSGKVKDLTADRALVAQIQSGNIYPPDVDLNHTGSSVITLPALTSAGSGTLTVQEWFEQINSGEVKDLRPDLARVAIDQSREIAPGEFVLLGSSAITLPAITSAATGEEIFTATSTISLPALTSSATATLTVHEAYEQINSGRVKDITLYQATIAQQQSGELAPPDIQEAVTGSSVISLPALTSVATATLTSHEGAEQIISGTVKDIRPDQAFNAIQQSGNIYPVDSTAPVSTDSSVSLPAITSSGTGVVTVHEWFAQIISGRIRDIRPERADVALRWSGTFAPIDVSVSGSSSITLPSLHSSATGLHTISVTGTSAISLPIILINSPDGFHPLPIDAATASGELGAGYTQPWTESSRFKLPRREPQIIGAVAYATLEIRGRARAIVIIRAKAHELLEIKVRHINKILAKASGKLRVHSKARVRGIATAKAAGKIIIDAEAKGVFRIRPEDLEQDELRFLGVID